MLIFASQQFCFWLAVVSFYPLGAFVGYYDTSLAALCTPASAQSTTLAGLLTLCRLSRESRKCERQCISLVVRRVLRRTYTADAGLVFCFGTFDDFTSDGFSASLDVFNDLVDCVAVSFVFPAEDFFEEVGFNFLSVWSDDFFE